VVPVEDVTPGTQEAAGRAPEPMEVAVGEAVATAGGEGGDALPEPALEVVCDTCFSKENQVQTYMHARIKFHAYS
jgi:hypothetical protein